MRRSTESRASGAMLLAKSRNPGNYKDHPLASLKILIAAITVAIHTTAIAHAETPESSTHRIAIAYEQPKNPAHERLRDLLVDARVLEQVQEILSAFRLPKMLPISIEGCDGDSDARFLY